MCGLGGLSCKNAGICSDVSNMLQEQGSERGCKNGITAPDLFHETGGKVAGGSSKASPFPSVRERPGLSGIGGSLGSHRGQAARPDAPT